MDTANLLSVPPGNLVYHLTIAMALAVILSLARVYRTKASPSPASDWMLAAGGLLALRLTLLAIDGLGLVKKTSGGTLLPTFERFVGLVGLLAFIWLCKLPTPKTAKWILLIGFALSMIALILSPVFLHFFEENEPFNHTKVDAGWSLFHLGLAILASVALLVLRPKGWDFAFGPFILLTVGIMLHISLGPWNTSSAGFVRLSEIAAYPLFAILAAHSLASHKLEAPPAEGKAPTPMQSSNLMMFMEALSDLGKVMQVQEQAELAQSIVKIIATRMDADYCLLIIPSDKKEQIALATGYDLQQGSYLRSKTIQSKELPLISHALQHGKSIRIQDQRGLQDMHTLKTILGQSQIGPGMFIPFSAGEIAFGGLLLISSPAIGPWSSIDHEIAERLASILSQRFMELKRSNALDEARKQQRKLAQAEQRLQTLEREKRQVEQALQSMKAKEDDLDDQSIIAGKRFQEEMIPKKDFDLLLEIHNTDQEEILKLKEVIEQLKAIPRAEDAPAGSKQLQQLMDERHLALKELAYTRNSLQRKDDPHAIGEKMAGEAMPNAAAIIDIAQELRQPLSSILGYTELLLSESVGLLGTMQQKFLKRIRNAIERINALLNNLLQITDLKGEPLKLGPGPVEVTHCLEQAISQVSIQMREKQITLKMSIPEVYAPVLGDDDAIVQAIYHMLYNAIMASPAGSEVHIRLREQEFERRKYLMVSARDCGEGIPADQLPRLFQSAYASDRPSITGIGDRGIGLSMMKSLAEKLGGRVWVNSEVGKGSTFTILLPIAERDH